MVVVDSSVWIDYLGGRVSGATDRLDALLEDGDVVTGDLVVTEVLQGFRHGSDHVATRTALLATTVVGMLGVENALASAEAYRTLRRRGVTVRKTIDVVIATYCLQAGLPLLFTDRDFLPCVEHLGLRAA